MRRLENSSFYLQRYSFDEDEPEEDGESLGTLPDEETGPIESEEGFDEEV